MQDGTLKWRYKVADCCVVDVPASPAVAPRAPSSDCGSESPIASARSGEREPAAAVCRCRPSHPVPDVDPLVNPAEIVERNETGTVVRAALNELPTAYRIALTLYYFRELKYEEIATVLNLPLNTVKAHIRRGKLALASRLGAAEAEEAT